MPENPNIDPETGSEFNIQKYVTMATNVSNMNSNGNNNNNNNNINNNNRKSAVPRIPSAGLKYYDIATQLLGKAGSDLEELFIAAARDGVYDRIENFLQRNRSDAIVSIDVKDKKTGNTPLIWAAKRGHAKIVQLLLRHGADITLRNYEGHTAIEVASPSIRSILLESVERQTEANHLLLLQAAWQGDIKVVSRLLSQKKVIDVNCKNAEGYTPIMLATRDIHLFEKLSTQMSRPYNPVEVVAELLASRADVHATDSDGKTSLHHACQSKAIIAHSVVSTIISGGSVLETKDKRCFAPIHCASLTGNADCITTLLDGGSEVNSRGFAGATPLHITSYNNHEKATAVLLEYGADVAMQDDRGLTAYDLARSRKMKKKLQEAWTEVKKSTTSLGPLRSHSREDLRTSIEDLTIKRKKGEVIFDGMPANPFSDGNKKDSSTTIASNRGLTRHSSLKEKSTKGDELENGSPSLLSQFPKEGPRKLGQVRSMKPTPLPRTKSRSTERLPAISPDRASMPDRNLESPVHFSRNARARRSLEDKKLMGRGRRMAPLSTREGSTAGDEGLTSGAPSPTPSALHKRSDSDPYRGTPNLTDIAASCDPYLHMQRRGRSYSMSSNTEGLDYYGPTPVQRESTFASVQRESTLMSICSVRTESRMSTNCNPSPRLLNLGQMLPNNRTPVQNNPLYGPSSSKVIPPTPTFITQRSVTRTDNNSEMDVSPRSEDGIDFYKGVLENPAELIRTHTFFKDEFVLEESRPKDPHSQSSSVTPSDSGSSSGSSHLSSPREAPHVHSKQTPKTARKTNKASAQQNLGKKSGGQSNPLAGSVSVTKSKLNEKSVISEKIVSNSDKSGKVGGDKNSVNSTGESVTVPNTNAKNITVLHAAAMRNVASINANKPVVSTSSSIHGASDTVQRDVNVTTSGNPKSRTTAARENTQTEASSMPKGVIDKKPDISASSKAQTSGANMSSNSSVQSKNASKDMKNVPTSNPKTTYSRNKQNTLRIVPTKLTENIIQGSSKDAGESVSIINDTDVNDKSTKKDSNEPDSTKVADSNKPDTNATEQKTVENTTKQSATGKGVVTFNNSTKSCLVVNQQTGAKKSNSNLQVETGQTQTSAKVNVEDNKCVQTSNTADSGNKTVSAIQSGAKAVKSINQSNSNRMVQQSASAQLNSRQGTQSRNSNMSKNLNADPGQRPMIMVKKENSVPTSKKTPRAASNVQKSQSNDKSSDKSNVQTFKTTPAQQGDIKPKSFQQTSETVDRAGTGETKNMTSPSPKTVSSTSPTDLVTMSICRTASMSKSYNMSSVQTSAKSAVNPPNTVMDSAPITASSHQGVANAKKSAEVSKSSSEILKGSAKMTNTSNIVSKSISQMPSVGSMTKDGASSAKGILRSSSMSTIEESKVVINSTSDIEGSGTGTTKRRPSSDGPAGLTSNSQITEPAGRSNAPLIDILPQRGGVSTMIKTGNYLNPEVQHSTPVIVNPFEELEQKREEENLLKLGKYVSATDFGFIVEKPGMERSKTQGSMKSKSSKNSRKSKDKPSSASSRVSSGRRRRAKSKDNSGNKSDGESSRPKSGKSSKRSKSAKRKRKMPEGSLAKANEKSNVALIGGIGWHLKTSCIDKSDVDAVIVSQIDSSESESESCQEISPLRLEIPEHRHHGKTLDSPATASPRFKEVRPEMNGRMDMPVALNDGYPPMNLDMTQASLSSKQSENRAGVYIEHNLPDDINAFLSKLQQQESQEFDSVEEDDGESYLSDDYDEDMMNAMHRDVMIGKLTPIPESPAHTHTGTASTLQHVARTVKAINNFDANLNEDDLNVLLGATPRDKHSSSSNSANSGRVQLKKESKPSSSMSKPGSSTSNVSKGTPVSAVSRSSKISVGSKSANSERTVSVSSKQSSAPQSRNFVKNAAPENNSQNFQKASTAERSFSRISKKYEVNATDKVAETKSSDSGKPAEVKDNKSGSNLKSLLAEKMQGIQRLLEESSSASRARAARRKLDSQGSDASDRNSLSGDKTPTNEEEELKFGNVNSDIVIDLSNRGFETERTDDDIKSTRSSRKERKFSETKTSIPDDDIKEAIDEIFSNTFPSSRSNHRSGNPSLNNSLRSRNSTLTEADRNVLAQMANENHASPFHAKENSTRISSSYDEGGTLNKDNPELLQRIHADQFHLGQKVKAMIDAGADSARVKQMMKSDSEAKQLAKIMNSFRQMELYAGPHGTNNKSSSKKETPRRDAEVNRSYSHHAKTSSVQKGMVPRPGSAGAGRVRTGKFTEIKDKMTSAGTVEKPQSAVPKKLAEEFERSPFKQVMSVGTVDQLMQLEKAVTTSSSDTDEEERINLLDDTLESRPDSACTTLSSHSSIMEETIQWKKGNVLGKGAFGTVWCGLTSEGQLIAVKQIELNTNNHHKAKKEYEKVQEEVELLKTLEHKNIVGYLGTSLEDSIVSIFMQFVPGGSIASILARFGALDEAVFRKYTKQILEGVQYLHQNDVIHRDIKGGNVMLMPNGVIKLIDFGCAKRLCINLSMGQSEILKSMKGTPYWMAPEVVNETGHGKKSDIWSIGCTVFEMATRKPPWAEMNPMAAIFAIGSNKAVPQLPVRFSDEAREFVNCCLTKDQTKRLAASELLQLTFIKRKNRKTSSNC